MSIDNTYKELLRKLADGTISDQEKWQLERASLDDPFLADALEGYYDNKEEQHKLAKLEKRLQAPKDKQRKIVPLRWLSVAASLLILFSASYWMFRHNNADLHSHEEAAVSSKTARQSSSNDKDIVSLETSKTSAAVVSEDLVSDRAHSEQQPSRTIPTSAPLIKQAPIKASSEVIDKVVHKKRKPKEDEGQVVGNSNSNWQANSESSPPIAQEDEIATSNKSVETKSKTESSPPQAQEEFILMDEVVTSNKSVETKSKSNNTPYPETRDKVLESLDEEKVSYDYLDDINLDANLNAAPAIPIPTIIEGVITDETGMPVPGVQLVDLKNNELTTTDARGNFVLPQTQGYAITAFAGYDSLTVALAPQLDIKLRPISKTLSEPLKRRVDLMDDNDLRIFYKDQLNSLFFRNWPLCRTGWDNSFNNNPSSIRVNLSIDPQGKIDDVFYYRELNDDCKDKISSVLKEAEQSIFKDERPISFSIRINL